MLRDAVGRLGARLLAHAAVRHGCSTWGETAGGCLGSRAFLSSSRLFSAHPAPLPEEEPPADTVGCALARMLEQGFATTSLKHSQSNFRLFRKRQQVVTSVTVLSVPVVFFVCREECSQRAEAELAAHDQLVTQLTLLHHQVRSQHAVHRGYAPRNLLTDAYYTPVRCPCAWPPTSFLCCAP